MNRTFVPPTSAANDTSAPSGHPRPFTAGATSPYGISFVHEENHTTVTSSEHPPIRPVTAPGAFSFEFKIPGPEQTDNLESAVPQDAAALKSQTPPIPATSSLKPNTSSFVIRTPLSPRTSQNKPWPMQHPRRRRQQYSTSSKPPAEQTDGAEPKKPRGRKAKAEVAEGSKPRGRKPKAKSEEANVDGNEGAADKDGKAPPRPVINAPKKPLSAWQLYFQKWVHDRMGSTHVYDGKPADRMSVHREAKLASAAYNELSTEEIDKWEELAKEEKKNYEKAYKEWQKKLRPDVIQAENRFRAHSRRHGLNGQKYSRSNMKDPNQPPKPLSAFFLFQKEIQNDPELSKKYFGDLQDAKERAKAAANGWRGLTPEQKRPYLEKAARDKAEWDETQAVYLEMTEHLPSGVDLPPYPTIEEAREYMRQKSARISLSARPQARSAQTQDPTKATA